MKFHLPKKLMVAVLSALCACGNVSYSVQMTPSFVNKVTDDVIFENALPGELAASTAVTSPYVKDGSAVLSITGVGSSSSPVSMGTPLYVREGEVNLKDVFVKTSFSNYNHLQVAGNSAKLVLDNSIIQDNNWTYTNVGGADGEGTLIMRNGSYIQTCASFFAGYHHGVNMYSVHYTTGTDGERYANGSYTESGGLKHGKAVINVESGSSINIYTCFAIGMADVTVSGKSADGITKSSIRVGYWQMAPTDDNLNAYSIILGRWAGCTSNLIINEGGEVTTQNHLITAYTYAPSRTYNIEGSTSNIVVDGTDSLLKVEGMTYLGYCNDYNSKTTLSITGGGSVLLENASLGSAMDGTKKAVVDVLVDKESSYTGSVLQINENATFVNEGNCDVDTMNINDGGNFSLQGSAAKLETSSLAVSAGGTFELAGAGEKSVTVDTMTVDEGGVISLKDGNTLTVTGALTLAQGAIITVGQGYQTGDVLLTSTGSLTDNGVVVEFEGAEGQYEYVNGSYVVTSIAYIMPAIDPGVAKTYTLSNWGIATASRAVVNAVRGQRCNTGCIADGKGTAWVASLGSKHDINGSDINISGAAVGADMQVGRNSRIGIALGYAEGEVQPSGLRQVDQEGSYIAAYGEHGLKKLSSTSCLSMDWVAAYGVTDSEGAGLKWEQDSVQLNSRVNWNKKVNDKLCMSVFGGLEYFANNSDTVNGVKTGSIQNLRGEIGVGARYVAWGAPAATASYDEKGAMLTEARPGCEKLVLNGEIRYMNDMVRSNPVIRMEGLSGMGENPGRQGMGIEAGATYRIGERWSASANYGFNTMEDSKEHRVNVGAAYTF